MVIFLVLLVFELTVVGVAWRAGGKSERRGAVVVLLMVAVTYLGHPVFGATYNKVDPVALAVDLIGLIGFCWIGFEARRFWPLWAASLQFLSTGAHLIRALEIPVRPAVYYWMKAVPTLGVLILLLLATWLHRRREARVRRNCSPN